MVGGVGGGEAAAARLPRRRSDEEGVLGTGKDCICSACNAAAREGRGKALLSVGRAHQLRVDLVHDLLLLPLLPCQDPPHPLQRRHLTRVRVRVRVRLRS